jgi:transaldolase
MTQSTLEQLKLFSKVVADMGDFELIEKVKPLDATTNPSLILKAAQQPQYAHLAKHGGAIVRSKGITDALDHLVVLFGLEIRTIIGGRVSTEVHARLSVDVEGTIEKAKDIIDLYEANGITRDRVLIKVAAAWEGICAGKTLEQEGIRRNLTPRFSKVQAFACSEANVTLISPCMGRILDWYQAKTSIEYTQNDDPGVKSLIEIFNYYKNFGGKTEIRAASFRNIVEIIALSGCDLLTISPTLLEILNLSIQKIGKIYRLEKVKRCKSKNYPTTRKHSATNSIKT